MNPSRASIALLLAAVLPFSGCQTFEEHSLTGKLWSDPSLTDYYEPAGTATLKTFQQPPAHRMLVAYDERREKDSSLRRRAFFLPDSTPVLAAQRKPSFASPSPGAGWVEVPVVMAGEPAPAVPLYVQLAADRKRFTVVRSGVADPPLQLPTYVDQGSTAFRVAMTPVAAVADVTVVAFWCGVVVAYAYASAPFVFR